MSGTHFRGHDCMDAGGRVPTVGALSDSGSSYRGIRSGDKCYNSSMSQNTGFPPIAKSDAKILILGSMPGVKSFEKNQYYANPRNAFWSIMITLLNSDEALNYQQRKKLLTDNRIALWDVLKSCYREGSLDSSIDHSTIIANDFNLFLKKQKQVKAIFFNGGETEKLFKKYVMKELNNKEIEYFKLPSTSPAHAAMSFDQKLSNWRIIESFI